jgi:lipid-binding SYLF domain-containing protein
MGMQRSHIAALAAVAVAFGACLSAYADEKKEEKIEQDREHLTQMAEQTIQDVIKKNETAAALWKDAYGYAVFDATQGGLIVVGVGGTGVAMPKSGGEKVFMHVGGAGVGLAAGAETFKLVLLIQDKDTFDRFVNGQWRGSVKASAAVGPVGGSAENRFPNGIAGYRITGAGLMASMDVSALKFWPSDRLNKG